MIKNEFLMSFIVIDEFNVSLAKMEEEIKPKL